MNACDLEYYGKYADMLMSSCDALLDGINSVLDGLTQDPEYALAEHVRIRIKSSQSLRGKLIKQGFDEDARTGLTVLSDIIGARIVAHFIGDVYEILECIKQSGLWEIINIKDYISNPKTNGYRSLHVILRLPSGSPDFEFIMAEIQIRTIAMDCWASLEHQMRYKKNIKNIDLISDELKRCADEMASTDLSMQTIREMIRPDN
ncbi:MAG: hypothetical protein LUG83_08625 [Lachnospiraceae bacterium]|nr:hypothetical protein [Lachnospiraceae bacterium]